MIDLNETHNGDFFPFKRIIPVTCETNKEKLELLIPIPEINAESMEYNHFVFQVKDKESELYNKYFVYISLVDVDDIESSIVRYLIIDNLNDENYKLLLDSILLVFLPFKMKTLDFIDKEYKFSEFFSKFQKWKKEK